MITSREAAFIAEFQPRLKAVREKELDWSQARLADALGIGVNAYKKYEGRPESAFPMYLLPRLIELTRRPAHFWLGMPEHDDRRGRARLTVVNR